jgi:hypothetical protein
MFFLPCLFCRVASFPDVLTKNVKIPINNTLNIANNILNNNQVHEHITRDIMTILKMITNQNYFQHEGKFYKPTTV